MPKTTTAYLADGRHVDVPKDAVRDWQYEVRNGDTTDSLAAWYTEDGDEHQDEIQGTADDNPRCDHDETSHRIVNESQTGDYDKDKPMRMARVCHRRACILDALAWVERGTGEPAAWAAPHQEYSFDVPKNIPAPGPVVPAAPVAPAPASAVAAASQGSRLRALLADHDRGPEYAFVQCTGRDFAGDHVGELTCTQNTRIENSKDLSDTEITARLAELGWSVKPTLCPKHNITSGQVPLPVPEMAL